MKKNDDTKRDIHVQAIITSLAAATFEAYEWNKPQVPILDINRIYLLWEMFIEKYGEYPVQELSFTEIEGMLKNFYVTEAEFSIDTDLIKRTMKFLKLQIEDNERFEDWIRRALKSTRAMEKTTNEHPDGYTRF
jgi:hypothetical protein